MIRIARRLTYRYPLAAAAGVAVVSNYTAFTRHPVTSEWELAEWLNDYFGRHNYGVRFADGSVIDPRATRLEVSDTYVSKPGQDWAVRIAEPPL